jgi:hypothetical protein
MGRSTFRLTSLMTFLSLTATHHAKPKLRGMGPKKMSRWTPKISFFSCLSNRDGYNAGTSKQLWPGLDQGGEILGVTANAPTADEVTAVHEVRND